MLSERGLSTILHCLQWYKLVVRTRLFTAAVQYELYILSGIWLFEFCHRLRVGFLANLHGNRRT